jgi:TonB-dependent Receptor Plug Domain
VDDGSKLPLSAVLVTIVDEAGVETLPVVRSDSLGNFIVHASRAGTWRVKAIRIGYSPVMSDRVALGVGGLAVVRLRMTTFAQQLVPVVVIEKRQLNATELMSASGFDLRVSRGLGKFLSAERLAAMGKDNVQEILGTYFQPTLYVYNDTVLGDILHIRQGGSECEPEIYLDGRLLATAPEPGAVVERTPPRTMLDSMRAQTRAQSERMRVGFGQMSALTQLSSLTADALHGIEVYRANEVPPPSLGAWFGMTRASIRSCGTVAVWTKRGAQSLVVARRASPADSRAIQVISGTLIDFDTGMPLSKRAVSLLDEGRDPIGAAVMTDENGDFTVRTGRAADLRLMAGGNEYLTSTTPPFRISANEMIVVKLFVSAKTGVLAPLGVAARLMPQNIGVASLAGFTYRRERAVGGTFLRGSDIAASGAKSLADVVRSIPGVSISDTPTPGTIAITREGRAPCTPVYHVDGVRLGDDPRSTIGALAFDRLFGVELYTRESDVPSVFADGAPCAVIVIWTNR